MAHVTFIHGIANKPSPEVLLRLWRQGLARDEGLWIQSIIAALAEDFQ